jgi:rhodanese-related sulfurtransferase
MSASPDVQVLRVAGGTYKSRRACGSLTPHGYYGIEADVVGGIVKWMRSKTP